MIDYKKTKQVIEQAGGTNIEMYNLINNWGYTFEVGEYKFDARYWANCYGCALNTWSVLLCKRIDLSEDQKKEAKSIAKGIEKGLNKKDVEEFESATYESAEQMQLEIEPPDEN